VVEAENAGPGRERHPFGNKEPGSPNGRRVRRYSFAVLLRSVNLKVVRTAVSLTRSVQRSLTRTAGLLRGGPSRLPPWLTCHGMTYGQRDGCCGFRPAARIRGKRMLVESDAEGGEYQPMTAALSSNMFTLTVMSE
jgi:hypothetical protein